MTEYLNIKKQFNAKIDLFNNAVKTNKLSDFIEAIEFKIDSPTNYKNNAFFNNVTSEFFSFLEENKYHISYTWMTWNPNRKPKDKVLDIAINLKHNWNVKYLPEKTYNSIVLYGDGSTKASFEDETVASDFAPFKGIAKHLASYMLENVPILNYLNKPTSNIPFYIVMQQLIKKNNITSITLDANYDVQARPAVDNNNLTISLDTVGVQERYRTLAIICQLLDNDVFTVGGVSKAEVCGINFQYTITDLDGKRCSYNETRSDDFAPNFSKKDIHLSTLIWNLYFR